MRAQIFTAASAANLSLALGFVRCSRPSSAGPPGLWGIRRPVMVRMSVSLPQSSLGGARLAAFGWGGISALNDLFDLSARFLCRQSFVLLDGTGFGRQFVVLDSFAKPTRILS